MSRFQGNRNRFHQMFHSGAAPMTCRCRLYPAPGWVLRGKWAIHSHKSPPVMKKISFMWWHKFIPAELDTLLSREAWVMHPISFIMSKNFIIPYFITLISRKWMPKFERSTLLQEFPWFACAKMLPKTVLTTSRGVTSSLCYWLPR